CAKGAGISAVLPVDYW
nr:immunoglobulin heavy chain junction region [Macaca mulatta]